MNSLPDYAPLLLNAAFFVEMALVAGLIFLVYKLENLTAQFRDKQDGWMEMIRQLRYDAKLAKDTAQVAREDIRDALRGIFGALPTVLRLVLWLACRKRPDSSPIANSR